MKVLTLVASAVLLAGCEVNLNTEGLSARELKTFKVTGQPEVVLDTFEADRAGKQPARPLRGSEPARSYMSVTSAHRGLNRLERRRLSVARTAPAGGRAAAMTDRLASAPCKHCDEPSAVVPLPGSGRAAPHLTITVRRHERLPRRVD